MKIDEIQLGTEYVVKDYRASGARQVRAEEIVTVTASTREWSQKKRNERQVRCTVVAVAKWYGMKPATVGSQITLPARVFIEPTAVAAARSTRVEQQIAHQQEVLERINQLLFPGRRVGRRAGLKGISILMPVAEWDKELDRLEWLIAAQLRHRQQKRQAALIAALRETIL